jgi:hypothetical protein
MLVVQVVEQLVETLLPQEEFQPSPLLFPVRMVTLSAMVQLVVMEQQARLTTLVVEVVVLVRPASLHLLLHQLVVRAETAYAST